MFSRCKTTFYLAFFFFLSMQLNDIASGAILFENVLNSSGYGLRSNTGSQQIADEFEIGTDSVVMSINFYGCYQDDLLHEFENFDMIFYGDNGLYPSTSFIAEYYDVLPSVIVDTGLDRELGGSINKYTIDLPSPLNVPVGMYYVAIRSDSSINWVFLYSDHDEDNPYRYIRFSDTQRWSRSDTWWNNDFAFTLHGSQVPIPSAIWLLVSGLIGLVGVKRKFKKA